MYIHLGFFIFISIPCRFSCSMFFGSMLFAKKVRHSTFGADGSSQPTFFPKVHLTSACFEMKFETNKYPTRNELDDYFPNTSLYSFVSCLVGNLRSSSYKVSFSDVTVQTAKWQLYSSCRLSSRNLLVPQKVEFATALMLFKFDTAPARSAFFQWSIAHRPPQWWWTKKEVERIWGPHFADRGSSCGGISCTCGARISG